MTYVVTTRVEDDAIYQKFLTLNLFKLERIGTTTDGIFRKDAIRLKGSSEFFFVHDLKMFHIPFDVEWIDDINQIKYGIYNRKGQSKSLRLRTLIESAENFDDRKIGLGLMPWTAVKTETVDELLEGFGNNSEEIFANSEDSVVITKKYEDDYSYRNQALR